MFSTHFDEKAKLWSGRDVLPLYNPKISIAQALFNSMNNFGSKIAQISDNNGMKMSFDEIRMKSIRVAQNIQERGYKTKQVFGIIARNSHHVAPVVFGTLAIGCPLNTLDPSFGRTELMHMLKSMNPVLMFCDIQCYDLLKDCLTELGSDSVHTIFTFGGSKDCSEPVENLFVETHKENQFAPAKVDGLNDIAMIICSSGTTGLSKGVCLSHAALLDAMTSFNVNAFDDVMVCFSSLYWLSGVAVLLKGTLCGSTRIITTEVFAPELQLQMIERYKVTFTLNAPHQIVLMMKNDRLNKTDMSSLKLLTIGGSKVPLHLKTDVSHHLPNGNVHVGYGMSEIGGCISIDLPTTSGKDTVGQLSCGTHVKIIDDHGSRCGPNVDGEICLKLRYRFLGYYDNQQATDETFDEEGFIVTGDIGHFDDDGYLYIVDRKKDLLKYYNFQISPSEIDAYLIESPDIKSACVVGIPDLMGDLPAAVIVRTEGSNISEKEIFDMVADHFADFYKLRGGVYFVDSLPTTPSGKILRRNVKEIAIALFNARTDI